MKFAELPTPDKVRHIKDRYVKILESIARDPKELDKYVGHLPDPSLLKTPLSPTKEVNDKLQAEASESYAKDKAAYDEQERNKEALKKIFADLKPNEYCICVPKEIDTSSIMNSVIPELDVFVDFARKEAEAATY